MEGKPVPGWREKAAIATLLVMAVWLAASWRVWSGCERRDERGQDRQSTGAATSLDATLSPEPLLATPSPQPPTPEPTKRIPLAEGFREARWGLSPEEVVRVLGAKVLRSNDSAWTLSLPDGKEILCSFYEGKLFDAVLKIPPHVLFDDKPRPEEYLAALTLKYGEGKRVDDLTLEWEDESTAIRYTKKLSPKGEVGALIHYSSKKMKTVAEEKAAEELARREREIKEEKDKRIRDLGKEL